MKTIKFMLIGAALYFLAERYDLVNKIIAKFTANNSDETQNQAN